MSETSKKLCFVISPIGEDGSPERDAADWFLEIVRQALETTFVIQRADVHKKSGLITSQIIQLIEAADLIVVDLTGHNPNVHYELGVAHAREKVVVPMMMKGDRLPFDNAHMRTIFYSRAHPKDYAAAVASLRDAVAIALAEPVQNPVTHALGTLTLSKGDDKDQIIATMSAQVANHEADIAGLKKNFGDLVGVVARDIKSRTPDPPVNFFTDNTTPVAGGGLFGIAGSPPPQPYSSWADVLLPTKGPKKK